MATTIRTYAAPESSYRPLQSAFIDEERARREKDERAALAIAIEEAKVTAAKQAVQKQEMVNKAVEWHLRSNQMSEGGMQNKPMVDPNGPQSFSNIHPQDRMTQGGKGALSSALGGEQQNRGRSPEADMDPLVRKELLGNAFGEFPKERMAREEASADRLDQRQAQRDANALRMKEESDTRILGRMHDQEREKEKRDVQKNFAMAVTTIRAAREKSIGEADKIFGLGASDPKSSMHKQWKRMREDAIQTERADLANTRKGYHIMANSLGIDLPVVDDPKLHPVEVQALQDRLAQINPDWLSSKGLELEGILRFAREKKADPFEMLKQIEEAFTAEGGRLGQEKKKWYSR